MSLVLTCLIGVIRIGDIFVCYDAKQQRSAMIDTAGDIQARMGRKPTLAGGEGSTSLEYIPSNVLRKLIRTVVSS